MTVDISKIKTVPILQLKQLQSLHTGTLLSRLKALRALHECEEQADWSAEEIAAVQASPHIAFKSQDKWKDAFADVKAVLATREHIPRGGKASRRQAAHQRQNK